jgi:transcriptional regulator with XRE-family HTH domain
MRPHYRPVEPPEVEFIGTRIVRRLGTQVVEFCKEQHIQQQELAECIGLSKSHLSQIVKRGGTKAQIEAIARGLMISPWKFDVYHILTFDERILAGDETALLVALTLIESKKKERHEEVVTTLKLLVGD